ncbi:MAG: aa3-type cytochrome oxidase subunit II [Segniliparus sp.]|uniref:aa3-type cytochrome oxidase subunit II n=1 Tax=Segniliparus sp. TaxID=2804064 RepID=UPI003F31AE87
MRKLRPTLDFRRLRWPAVLGLAAFSLSGCSVYDDFRFGWPQGVTPQATAMGDFWVWSCVAALAVGVVVWAAMFWTMYFDRKSRLKEGSPEFPRQTGYNAVLEMICTVLPTIIVAGLFYYTVVTQNFVEKKVSNPNVVVDVTAFRWNWKFGYNKVEKVGSVADYDGHLENTVNGKPYREGEGEEGEGKRWPLPVNNRSADDISYLAFNKIETVGTDNEIPVLVLPTDKIVEFRLASRDVVHSFWVIDFLFKRDVFPNPKENQTDNVFQITKIEHEGAFVGRCAELCGTYHSMMNFEVRAVAPEKFAKYLEARKAGKSNADALASIGEQPLATTTHPDPVRVAERPNSSQAQ